MSTTTRTRRHLLTWIAVGVLAAALVVWFAVYQRSTEPPGSYDHTGVATYPFARGAQAAGDQALLSGAVTVTGGCVYVVDEAGTSYLPVFPSSQVSREDGGLRFAGTTHPWGSVVDLGGGYVSIEPGSSAVVPDECDTTSVFWVTPG